jgi:hypothetical protein
VFFEPRKNMATPIQTITTTRKKKFMMFTRYYRDEQTFLSNQLVGIPSSGPVQINITPVRKFRGGRDDSLCKLDEPWVFVAG